MPSSSAPIALRKALGAFVRRWRLQRALHALGPAGLPGLPLVAWAVTGGPEEALWTGLAVLLLGPALAAAWPLALARVAREADRVAGLDGTADTALHLAETDHPAAAAVAADAVDALDGARPAPLSWRRPALLVALGVLIAGPVATIEPRRAAAEAEETAELLETLAEVSEDAQGRGDQELAEEAEALRDLVVQVLAQDPPDEPEADPEPEDPQRPDPGGPATTDPNIGAVRQALDAARHQLGPEEIARLTEELNRIVDVRDRLHEVSETRTTGKVGWHDTPTTPVERPSRPSRPGFDAQNKALDAFERDLEMPGQDALNDQIAEDLEESHPGNLEDEMGHVFQQTIDDFVEDYAQSLLQELQDLLNEEADRNPEGQLATAATEATFAPPQEGTPDDPGAQATAVAAQGGGALARSGTGGMANTDPGGSGAGRGPGGEGDEVEIGEARGEVAPLESDADLDGLGPSERRDLFAAVSKHATAEDVGLSLDALAEPYFLEVDEALDADGVPPAMRSVIEAYFSSLEATPTPAEATP